MRGFHQRRQWMSEERRKGAHGRAGLAFPVTTRPAVALRAVFAAWCLLASLPAHAVEPTKGAAPPASTPAVSMPHAMGTHGMVLFGGLDGLYASHLAMFRSPHDHQVVLRIRLTDPAVELAVRRELAARPALWTLSPERFDLLRLRPGAAQPLQRFQADVVQGHFEQDGVTRHAQVTVVVEQTLVFEDLSPQPREQALARFYVVGQGRERFLVKHVDARPDYDAIIALEASPVQRAADPAATATPPLVSVPKPSLEAPSNEALTAALRAQLGSPTAVRATIYFLTDDLR